MEDPNKVADKIRELNNGKKDGPWLSVQGNNYLPFAQIDNKDTFKFDTNRGYVVKLFINIHTGEMRQFPAALFEYK
jgi:hypothetical protein